MNDPSGSYLFDPLTSACAAGSSSQLETMPTRSSTRVKSTFSRSSSTGKKMYEEEISSEGSNFDQLAPGNQVHRKTSSFLDKNSQEYKEKRERNNNAVKASRERFAKKYEKVSKDVHTLEKERKNLRVEVRDAKTSFQTLKDLYEAANGPMDHWTYQSLFQKD